MVYIWPDLLIDYKAQLFETIGIYNWGFYEILEFNNDVFIFCVFSKLRAS